MMLTRFFTAGADSQLSCMFRYLQLERHQIGFTVSLPAGASTDLIVVGQ